MQLLIANYVIQNFEGADLALLKQLVNAKIVLPKDLFDTNVKAIGSPAARNAEEEKQFVSLPSGDAKSPGSFTVRN